MLSQKSRLLLQKGAAYQNDIGCLISTWPSIFNFLEFVGLTYHFILYLNSLNNNCFSYKFFDTVEKKIRDCRIYSPFLHFKNNGFEFQRIIPPQGKENVSIRHFENNKKIQTVFTLDYKKNWYVSSLNFRDLNSLFAYDEQDWKWYGTSPLSFIEATYYAVTTKKTNAECDVNKSFADFYLNKKKGSKYVVGNFDERKKLNSQGKGFLMPIIQLTPKSVSLSRNEVVYAPPYLTRGANFGITKNCKHLGVRKLSDEDKKQLNN